MLPIFRVTSPLVAATATGLAALALLPAMPTPQVQALHAPAAVVLVVGHAPTMM